MHPSWHAPPTVPVCRSARPTDHLGRWPVSTPWPAPAATGPVRGRVAVPGSKSVTNRALLLAALSGGPSTVSGAPPTRDTALMVDALRALGVPIDVDGEHVVVRAHDGLRGGGRHRVDCGLAGTVMRFVPPAAALADGPVRFDGDPRARERPMGTVLDALRVLGARIDGPPDRPAPPCAPPVHPARRGSLPGGEVVIDASASSQFVSGLLLSGSRYEKGVTVVHDGKPVPSLPHIDMSVAMLRAAGVEVDDAEPNTWRVGPGCDRRPRLDRRAGPVQRGGVPRRRRRHRRRGHRRRLARALDPAGRRDPAGARAVRRLGRARSGRYDGPRPGHPGRGRRRPPRRRRAHPDRRRRRRARGRPRRGCAGSRTCAATRRTAWPRSPPRSPRSAATSRRRTTAS